MKIGKYVYIRVSRDSGAIGYHIPAWIKEVHDNGVATVVFEMYGREEEVDLTEQEIQDAADEVALGLKEY